MWSIHVIEYNVYIRSGTASSEKFLGEVPHTTVLFVTGNGYPMEYKKDKKTCVLYLVYVKTPLDNPFCALGDATRRKRGVY